MNRRQSSLSPTRRPLLAALPARWLALLQALLGAPLVLALALALGTSCRTGYRRKAARSTRGQSGGR